MDLLTLQDLAVSASQIDSNFAAFAALGIVIFLLALVLLIAVYVYVSLAFVGIARKAKYKSPGIVWIPIVGPAIILSSSAGMHWWPILLLIGTLIPFVGILFGIAFAVFFTIWTWKTFEKIKKPGWWSILCLISPLNLIFWGIAAWSK
ncbi:MAG: hypothetical protein ABIE22_04320 [archaeon]